MRIGGLSFDPFNLPGGMRLPKIPRFFSAGLTVSRVQIEVSPRDSAVDCTIIRRSLKSSAVVINQPRWGFCLF